MGVATDADGMSLVVRKESLDILQADGPMLDRRGKTVVALIAEPEKRQLHVAFGNPCENPFVTYGLD